MKKKNRWCIALAAVGIHLCIGSVYAWSVLTKPVMAELGLSLSQTTWAFSIAILFLGLSAGFLGGLVERIGPAKSGLLSAFFFGTGMLGTALAVYLKSAALLYIFYGFIGGIGLGTGYITPVSTLVKWFPRHRGFATGLAIMGFGFAALIAGPLMRWLVDTVGLMENFLILGCAYFTIIALSASYLRAPRRGEIPELLEDVIKNAKPTGKRRIIVGPQLTRGEAMHTWKWYALWWIFFTNITCGIGLLAVASPMSQEVIGLSPQQAASLVGIIGIVNGAGRIVWSTVSDWIGRGITYMIFFALEVWAFWQLSVTTEGLVFQALVLAIISCYGGGFSCMPAYITDIFGFRHLAAIHGSILTAWGMAGVAGPVILALLKESTGGYTATLLLFSGMLAVAFVIAAVLHFRNTIDRRQWAAANASAA
jgi:OFA family oxalate/formate antiporter-like MFS transporter